MGGRAGWSGAEQVWQEAEKVTRAKARFDRAGGDGRRFKKPVAGKAWEKAAAAFEAAQQQEQAWRPPWTCCGRMGN